MKKGGGARGARAEAGPEDDLESLSREQLYERAQREGVAGRSKMGKKELVEARSR